MREREKGGGSCIWIFGLFWINKMNEEGEIVKYS